MSVTDGLVACEVGSPERAAVDKCTSVPSNAAAAPTRSSRRAACADAHSPYPSADRRAGRALDVRPRRRRDRRRGLGLARRGTSPGPPRLRPADAPLAVRASRRRPRGRRRSGRTERRPGRRPLRRPRRRGGRGLGAARRRAGHDLPAGPPARGARAAGQGRRGGRPPRAPRRALRPGSLLALGAAARCRLPRSARVGGRGARTPAAPRRRTGCEAHDTRRAGVGRRGSGT